jgi:type I restriction enzyme S subunit
MTFPATWKSHKLGELAQYINGKAFKPEDWKTSGLPIIRIQNLTDSSKPFNYCVQPVESRYYVNDGDLLISWSATLGSFIWNRGPAVLNQHIFKAIPNAELVERDFLHFLMLDTLDEMAIHAHGIAMKHITKEKFEAIEVAIPPLPEQRRIVARIQECMERVEEIGANTTTVTRELDALFPALLNERFSGIREAHGARLLEDVTDIRGGSSLPKGAVIDQGAASVMLVKVGDMNADGNERTINGAREYFPLANAGRGVIEAGAVIFPKRGGAIATNKKRLLGRPALLDPNLMAVVAKREVLRPDYLYYWCLALDLSKLSNGGVIPQLNRKDLAPLEMPVPDMAAQVQIVEQLQQAEQHCSQLKIEFASAQADRARLREAILRKAFAGEL